MNRVIVIAIGVTMLLGLALADDGYGGGYYGGFYPSYGGGYGHSGKGGFGLLLPLLFVLILFPLLFDHESDDTVNVIKVTSG